ncbi:MAG: DUF2268 domain-containing putative Zn-dependent protease [Ferruginibacter sp.]
MKRVNEIYPEFIRPEIYFTISCLNSGEIIESNKVLIGAEIAAGDEPVDASELSEWLRRIFRLNNDVIYININEVIHVKQKNTGKALNLLETCIHEGAADFIAEQLLEREIKTPYITYGLAHEEELWNKFKQQMYGVETKGWLYNDKDVPVAGLGYFMGYIICKACYNYAENKTKAIAGILDLKYGDEKMLEELLVKSKYAYKINNES